MLKDKERLSEVWGLSTGGMSLPCAPLVITVMVTSQACLARAPRRDPWQVGCLPPAPLGTVVMIPHPQALLD